MNTSPLLATEPSERVSKQYIFVPTTAVVEALADEGWGIHASAETKSKKHVGFQRHMLRFRPLDPKNEIRVGDSFAELLMINSHNGATSYQFRGGVWRIVCGNGLIVSELEFPGVRMAHHHNTLQEILDASLAVAAKLPELVERVNRLRAKELSPLRALEFAREAAKIRYPVGQVIMPEDLLQVRREEDKPMDLYTVFNRVQENLSRGGQVGQVGATGQFRRMRPIGGMDRTIEVNEQLWDLAVAFAA